MTLVQVGVSPEGPILRRIRNSLRQEGTSDALWYLSFGPYALSLVFGLFGLVHMSVSWSIPIGFSFSILWIRNADPDSVEVACARVLTWFRWIWPGMLALSAVFAVAEAVSGMRELYAPEAEAAAQIVAEWQVQGHTQPLIWAASNVDAAREAFYWPALDLVEVLPALPDQLPDYYPPRADWRSEAGVVICLLGQGADIQTATPCTQGAEAWAAKTGLQLLLFRFSVQRTGVYFPRRIPYSYAAFYIFPAPLA